MSIAALICYGSVSREGRLEKNDDSRAAETLAGKLAEDYNEKGLRLFVNGSEVTEDKYAPYLSSDMHVMIPADTLVDKLGCVVDEYANGTVVVKKNNASVKLTLGSASADVSGAVDNTEDDGDVSGTDVTEDSVLMLSSATVETDDVIYVAAADVCGVLGYTCEYSYEANRVTFTKSGEDAALPSRYDMRDENRVTEVRDQGDSGTCWAFASLAALETTLMPDEKLQLSVDNMTKNNGFGVEQFEGGQYRMSIAYLASWQGPVLEEDDPYDDGETNSELKAVKHLQEAQIIEDEDIEKIKEAVYKKGGVETAIYIDMTDADSDSEYYNADTSAYYYDGSEGINHDVVIVGWDDGYSKTNFKKQPEKDGAFICKNSWGTEFGDDGYFYISYYDEHVGETSVVYTKLESADNYDHIYQSDKLGWVGVLGFESEEAYFANVYTAGKSEELAAVSFYATGPKTTYEVYVTTDFEDTESLADRVLVASGEMEYSGYYTVNLDESVPLDDGKKFAVTVHITTPDTDYPVAIEYDADSMTDSFDISDGDGYISLYGSQWYDAEEERSCNVCLKAFTVNKQ